MKFELRLLQKSTSCAFALQKSLGRAFFARPQLHFKTKRQKQVF